MGRSNRYYIIILFNAKEVVHASVIEKRVFKEYLVFQILLAFEIQIQMLKILNRQIQI